jgi:hypothetical protein
MATRHVKVEAEADLDFDDALAVRMIDYVQSVVASVPPAEQRRGRSVARALSDIGDRRAI